MFVNRERELEFLEEEYKTERASFVVIYGRRRVGKTTLIKEFISDKPSVFFLATQETEKQNLKTLKDLIANFTQNDLLKKTSEIPWDTLFTEFTRFKPAIKKVLVIDEFQYLGMTKRGFPSIFQRIWDEQLQNQNVMIIICGSIISMMKSQTLEYTSPLYGRRTGQINLGQIDFSHYHQFFKRDKQDLIDYYSVTGGVPRYIEELKDEEDIYLGIQRKILSRESYLFEEPVFLLEKELKEVGSYFSILKAIAQGNHKLSRISSRIEVNQTSLSPYLATLIEMDILRRRVPVTETNPGKSKKGLYYIKDNFLAFWFRYCFPYQSYLEIGNTDYVLYEIKKDFQPNHVSLIYENVCEQLLIRNNITQRLGLLKIGKWWDKRNEIDIVGLNPENNTILFCECKNTKKPAGLRLYKELCEKAKKVQWRNQDRKEYYGFFSRSGYEKPLQALAKNKENLFLF